jgi:CRP/FNR family transcriptional regulator, cyclic AMP receptor protein
MRKRDAIVEAEPALLLAGGSDSRAARYDLLGSLSAVERARVRKAGQLRVHVHGASVFHQGERHDGIFLIEGGRVRTYYIGASGREITLAYWTPGHFVGGPEIFGGGVHIWSGIAVGPTRTLYLSGAALRTLMREMPALAVCLVEGLSHKGRCYSELLQVLATQPVGERLRQLLQNLAGLYGRDDGVWHVIERQFSHEELATMVGATRQWVTMTLGRMQLQGAVRVTGRKIAVRCEGAAPMVRRREARPGAAPLGN